MRLFARLKTRSHPNTPLPPRRLQRIPDREKHTTAHKQRRLADAPRPLDRPELLPLYILQQTDIEDLRNISKARDLIRAWPARGQLPRGTMPQRFLGRKEPHALDERAFDLAVVDGRIDGAAYIHFEVGAQTRPVAGEGVDFDFGGGDALREVVEHLARVGAPDVADVRGAVEAVGGEVDAVEVSGVGEGLHGGGGAEFEFVGGKAGVELGAGVGDGVAVQIRGGGGCGRGGVGDGVGGGFGDEDVGERDVEGFGGDHGHFRVQALAHFRPAVGNEDGPVVVDVHEGPGLVEPDGGEGDAEFGGDEGETAFLPYVCFIELGDGLSSASIVRLVDDLLVHEWNVPVFEFLVEMCDVVWLVQVDLSELFNRDA